MFRKTVTPQFHYVTSKIFGRRKTGSSKAIPIFSEKDVNTTDRAIATIIESFGLLEPIPLSGKAIEESKGMRKHVISFGATGYIALYRYTEHDDCAVIARIYHQKEDYRADINSKLLGVDQS